MKIIDKIRNKKRIEELEKEIKDLKSVSITGIVREKFAGINININDFSGDIMQDMTENEKADFISKVSVLHENKALKTIMKHLVDVQGNYTLRNAETEKQRDFGIATINGIELVADAINTLNNLNKQSDTSDFNKYNIF